MNDQADKLRQVINNLRLKQVALQDRFFENLKRKNTRVIAITSGKGGVGKTNITINLAIALSELGLRVIILDADFGLANIDVLLGIVPQYTLLDVIKNKRNILEVLAQGPSNIRFLSGGSGVEELVKLDKKQLDKFIENIAFLDRIADFILIDTGAGLSDNVMSFLMAADEVLLVTTPEPTSITDAYALVKMLAGRDRSKFIRVIVNKAENANEARDILYKLVIVAKKFLNIDLYPLGYILNDEMVIKAVKMQQPFSLYYPKSRASRHIRQISRNLIDIGQEAIDAESNSLKGFVNRLVSFLTN